MKTRGSKTTKLKRRKEPGAARGRGSLAAGLQEQLDRRTRELAEAREQQAATGEILRVISNSPTDVQPVFDTIVRSAVRLCDGVIGAVNTFDGELTHCVAVHNYTPEALAAVQRMYPMRPSRQQLSGRAILSRAIVHVPDVLSDPEYAPDIALAGGWRGGLAVPMTHNEVAIGVILVMRAQAGPFSQEQKQSSRMLAACAQRIKGLSIASMGTPATLRRRTTPTPNCWSFSHGPRSVALAIALPVEFCWSAVRFTLRMSKPILSMRSWKKQASEQLLEFRCCGKLPCSALSPFIGKKSGPSLPGKSSWLRPSPTRR